MNTDIRLSVDFWDHPKTLKLERKMGLQGITALLRLWCWAGKYRPDGYLTEMDAQDAAIAARWKGSPEDFISALIEVGWIDPGDNLYLHDWQDHQPWAVGAPERSERARKAGRASAEARKAMHGTAQPNGSRTERSTHSERTFEQPPEQIPNPNARTPSPSPSPKPKKQKQGQDFILPDWINPEIWERYKEMRKKKKAEATDYALRLIVEDLEKLRVGGQDPNLVLKQSIKNNWTAVYEIKQTSGPAKHNGGGNIPKDPARTRFDSLPEPEKQKWRDRVLETRPGAEDLPGPALDAVACNLFTGSKNG